MMRYFYTKHFVFVGVIASIVLLSGCGEKAQQIKDTKNHITSAVETGKELTQKGKDMANDNGGVADGIKGMLKGGASLKCTNKDDGSVLYTNGKNMRAEAIEEGKKQQILILDGSTYIWDDATKNGMKMEKKCLEDFQKSIGTPKAPESAVEEGSGFSIEKLDKEEEAGTIHCVPSTQADFSEPADVTFVDQCQIMKQQMEGLQQQMKQLQ